MYVLTYWNSLKLKNTPLRNAVSLCKYVMIPSNFPDQCVISNAGWGCTRWYQKLSVQADFRNERPLTDMELDDMETQVSSDFLLGNYVLFLVP